MSNEEYTHREFWDEGIIVQMRKWNDKYDEACLRIYADIERIKNEKVIKDNKDRV